MARESLQELRGSGKTPGFTLIEMLIVIVILGILAMVIVPQITVSTEDAKVSTAKSNLTTLRGAIGRYYTEHENTYPTADVANQLLLFSSINGATSGTTSATFKLGPYLKGGINPKNPFNDLWNIATNNTADLTAPRVANGTSGWMYWPSLGIIFPNDGGSSGGVNHVDY